MRTISRASAIVGCLAVLASPSSAARVVAATVRVDHAAYDALLKRYVADGLVDYKAWKANDVHALKGYLTLLSMVDPKLLADRHERLAFWLNAYNALTIDAILHFYPVKSIKDKVSLLFGYNVWDDYPIRIGGLDYSLNDIEHKILRPMGDPRIHFAVVCASRGCPRLRDEAYTADRVDMQLDDNARRFFSSSAGMRIEHADRTVYLSSILKWFGKDFGETDAAKLAFVRRFVSAESDREFLTTPNLDISYLPYDWSLNERS